MKQNNQMNDVGDGIAALVHSMMEMGMTVGQASELMTRTSAQFLAKASGRKATAQLLSELAEEYRDRKGDN